MEHTQARVLVCILERSPITDYILTALRSSLSQYGDDQFIVVEEGACGELKSERMAHMFGTINVEDVDVVVSVGEDQSHLVYHAFRQRRYPPPVVSVAISSDTGLGYRKSRGFLTGVFIDNSNEYIPIQMVFRLFPHARKYLIPYLDKARFNRMSYDVKKMQKFLSDRRIQSQALALSDDISNESLLAAIQESDLVIIPESSIRTTDIARIESLCSQLNVPFFGDNQAAKKTGGVYGLKEDFEFIGIKAAEQVIAITKDNVPVSELEPFVVRDRRKYGVDSEHIAKSGVVVADDIIASLEGSDGSEHDVPTRSIALSTKNHDVLAWSFMFALTQRMQKEQSVNYLLPTYHSIVLDPESNDHMIKTILEKEYEHALFLGDQQAYHAWQYAKENNLPLPPSCTVVAFGDQLGPIDWHEEAEKDGMIVDRISVAGPSPTMPLQMLIDTMPKLKKVLVFAYVNDIDDVPSYLEERFGVLKALAHDNDIELSIVCHDDPRDLLDFTDSEEITQFDACLFFSDALMARSAGLVVKRLRRKGVVVCAGSPAFGQVAPLSFGLNLLKLREYVFDTLEKRYENPKHGPIAINLDEREIYAICVNHTLCVEMGVQVSPMLPCFSTHQCVDTMYERNIAACINAKPPSTERERQKHAAIVARARAEAQKEQGQAADGPLLTQSSTRKTEL